MSKAPHCSPLLSRHLLYFTPAVVYFKAQRIAVIKLQDTIYAPVCPGVHSWGWDAIFRPVPPERGHFCWHGCSTIQWQCGGHRHPKAVRQMQQLTEQLCCYWDVKEMFNTKLRRDESAQSRIAGPKQDTRPKRYHLHWPFHCSHKTEFYRV